MPAELNDVLLMMCRRVEVECSPGSRGMRFRRQVIVFLVAEPVLVKILLLIDTRAEVLNCRILQRSICSVLVATVTM